MRKNSKKILSLLAAVTLLGSTVVMSGCGGDYYKADGLDGYVASQNAANSNGGFAVEKDGYVYFINGKAENTAENKFGDVVKGALMRIKSADLNAGNYATAETVVPLLFVAGNYDAGIYIYGDYVYFATPTTDKDVKTGEVANTHIDFKRARLDGTQVMKNYYYRLESSNAKYRFVKGDDGVVYLLFEEDGALKSLNTEEEDAKPTVLVSGESISYYYDEKNPENPNVYYTMGVTYDIDTAMSSTASYNQIYSVNAATKAKVNADDASYTVKVFDSAANSYKDYKTYDFDKSYLEDKNAEAKKIAKENGTKYKAPYDFDDYSTYPYVNLGTLVVDGVGSKCAWTQYNNDAEKDTVRAELQGYTYTINRYENGGVYYTRKEVAPNTNLYYLADNTAANSISANAQAKVAINNTADVNDIANALIEVNEGVHIFVYTSGSSIYKLTTDANGAEASKIELTKQASGAKLWKTEGNTLYYTTTGTDEATGKNLNGMRLNSINYKGTADKYDPILGMNAEEEYKPLTVTYVDMATADNWYMPEIFGNTLMYANAQAYGTNSYYYIGATDLTKVRENNEKYEEVFESIKSYDTNTDLREAMEYYFRTGDREAFDTAYGKKLYTEYEKEEFDKFVASKDSEGEAIAINKQSALIATLGEVYAEDSALMNEGLLTLIAKETVVEEVTEEGGLKGWQIALIVVGGVIVVAAAVAVPVVLVSKNRKKKAEQEATVNAYKRKKIDTTDDKSIDVYAEDEAEESAKESEE